jgi:hypothetical protein
VKFFNNSSRRCGGGLLGSKLFAAQPGGLNATVVLSKKFPRKAYVFRNEFTVPPGAAAVILHYAGDMGKVNLLINEFGGGTVAPAFSASPAPWSKGQYTGDILDAEGGHRTLVTRHGQSKVIARGRIIEYRPNRRYDSIVVGTTNKNAKVVEVNRPHPTQSPTPAP